MNNQTIYELVTQVRQRADQLNSDTFDDATELIPAVHASLRQLYEIMVGTWQNWYTVSRPLSLIQGQQAYSLPSDLRALNDAFLFYNNGQGRLGLQKFEAWELGRWSNTYTGQYPLAYCVMRGLIHFAPTPQVNAPNAIELSYVPQYKAPLLNYTPMDDVLPAGFEEWAVCDVLQKMSTKTRLLNMEDIVAAKKEAFDRLQKGAYQRGGNAQQMRDAYIDDALCAPGGAIGGPAYWAVP